MIATVLTPEEIDALEPIYIGPTWKRKGDGSWLLPEDAGLKTLGWQVLGWVSKWLNAPDSGPDGRIPWCFTNEQARLILWWFAVNEKGRFIYRKGTLQRLKGHGKDPIAAVLCMVELVGPSRFSHFDRDGNPVGIPHPAAWVQVTGVNQSSTSTTMACLPALMSDDFQSAYQIEPGAELMRAMGGRCRLEAVTSSYRAIEGKRTTFTVLGESHHWVLGNQGHKMMETIDGNATKMGSRYLAVTNAFLPGEDSVAERMRGAWQKIQEGRAADVGFLYDSVEAHPSTPLTPEALRIVIPKIRGDSVWLDTETIIQSVLDLTIAPSRSRRMFLNQIVAEEDALYGPAEWDPLELPDATLHPGDALTLGFDGGKTDDATALLALRVSDMCAFPLAIWEKPDGPAGEGWEIGRDEVNSAVHEAFRVFDVKGFYADVALWESYISEWAEAYGEGLVVKAPGKTGVGFDMRGSQKVITAAHERLMSSVFEKKLRHDGDPTLRRHVLNARRRTNVYGVSFGKESRESPRKVDAYSALLLAHEALMDLRAGRKNTQRPGGSRGWFL